MARHTPPDRLSKLLEAASAIFVQHGFQRTQMDDVADALGVSKGTVYRSVESKEALLVAVLTHGDAPNEATTESLQSNRDLAAVSATLADHLGQATAGLALTAAVAAPRKPLSPTAFKTEVEAIVLGAYTMMASHRVRIMVLDRCAAELPELSGDWYESGRYALVDLFTQYLDQRSKHIDPTIDRQVFARTIVELITLWAVKMPWDPAPRPYPTDMGPSCARMIANLIKETP